MTWSTDESDLPSYVPIWRRKRWLFAGALTVVAIAATLYVVHGRSEIARQLAAIRARGEPTSLDELESYPASPPDGQDATRLWLRGLKLLALTDDGPDVARLPLFGETDLPKLGQPWTDIELSRQFLQTKTEGLQALHDAAALGGQARYSVWVGEQMDQAQWQRNAARCLTLEAHVRAYDGDFHGAAESIRTGLLLSNSLANAPTSMSQLVRMPLHAMAISELKRIGPANLPVGDLERLQETLAQIEFSSAVKRVAVGERAFGLTVFAGPDSSASLPTHLQYVSMFSRSMDFNLYLQISEELVDASELPWPERTTAMDDWANRTKTRATSIMPLTQLLLPIFPIIHTSLARSETINRLAMIDVAIARYQLKHDRPPESLSALAPDFLADVPLEPTKSAPFTYRATGESHLLYAPMDGRLAALIEVDAETGVDPRLVFRWPPLPEAPEPDSGEAPP